MVSTLLRDPQAISSTLASLRIQPQDFGSLKMLRDLGLSFNYYLMQEVAQDHA